MRIRPERVAQLMRREVADILANRLRDPRLGAMVSVTDVEVTPDLSVARIYVSILAAGAERDQALTVLGRSAAFVRRELAPRLSLREMPEIRFVHDTSIERGARIEELLRKLQAGESIPDEES
jgi:ribosome-binding factor A